MRVLKERLNAMEPRLMIEKISAPGNRSRDHLVSLQELTPLSNADTSVLNNKLPAIKIPRQLTVTDEK